MKIWSTVREIFEPFRVLLFGLKYRKRNFNNRTFAGNRFDIEKVHIGNETYGRINVYSYNDKNAGDLYIGNYCSIARTVTFLLSGNHDYKKFSTFPFEKAFFDKNYNGSKGSIIVEDDVWIGENCSILSGSHIGQGALIAAGAVVTGNIPPYSIVGGVPAKVIKYRFSKEIIDMLNKVDFSKIDKEQIYINKQNVLRNINSIEDIKWLIPYMK